MADKSLGQYARQIARQSGIFFAGTVFTTAIGFVFKIYIARQLGASALGIYAMGLSIVALVGGFSSLGFARAGIKFISKYKAKKQWYFLRAYLQRTTLITVGLGFLLALAVFLLRDSISQILFKEPDGSRYMIYFSLLIFFSSITGMLQAFAQGYQEVGRQTIIGSFIQFPVKIAVTVALITAGFGLTGYIIGEVAAVFVSLVLFALLIWKLTPQPVFKIRNIKKIPWDKSLLSLTGVMLGLKILGMFAGEIDKLVLGGFMSPKEVGIYTIAITIGGFIFILLRSLNTIFAPIIAEMYALHKHDQLKQIYFASSRWILLASAPLAISMIAQGKSYLKVFGEEFASGSTALAIIAVGYIINVSYGSIGMIAQMTGLEKKMFTYQVITSVASIVLFWALIPFWGVTGAAISISVNNILSNILISLAIKKERNIYILNGKQILLLTYLLICTLAVSIMGTSLPPMHYVFEILISLAVSGVLVLIFVLFSGFLKNDLKMLKQIFLSRRTTL